MDIAGLRDAGVLQAPLPRAAGGLGLGTGEGDAHVALSLLRLLGRGNLALGRVIEAHINAVRLVLRYGPPDLQEILAREIKDGHLIGLWVTDGPENPLRLVSRDRVAGEKTPCSGAGHVSRAVVTARDAGGLTRLAYVVLDAGVAATQLAGGTSGMRAACTGQVVFDGARASPFGAPGDYLREPDFSCGAWRTSAVTLGGMESLLDHYHRHLRARGRDGAPLQQARFGQAVMAVETARLWMAEAAPRAEAADAMPAIAYVGLARLAVERAALDLIELAQRSLGLPALLVGSPVERICRDLATYLRQAGWG